jgi:3-phenylpropionate/trans-cinnamate dioxygenase ferredoxin reductase subunit
LPNLSPNDVVYAAGAPAMTDSVARIAKAAGARCYTDPFLPDGNRVEPATMIGRIAGWLNQPPRGRVAMRPALAGSRRAAVANR